MEATRQNNLQHRWKHYPMGRPQTKRARNLSMKTSLLHKILRNIQFHGKVVLNTVSCQLILPYSVWALYLTNQLHACTCCKVVGICCYRIPHKMQYLQSWKINDPNRRLKPHGMQYFVVAQKWVHSVEQFPVCKHK